MAESSSRPRVFLDVQCGADFFGRICIELFKDKTPKTCKNFQEICTASYTQPGVTEPLTYKLSPFHRVIDEFMIQGGDITAGDGTGGASIYGGDFEDENIGWREIDKEGLVCMANRGKSTNSSQFFITLAPCPHLNAKHTVFGHVVSGPEILERIAKVPVDAKDRPLSDIIIARCGELERRKKPIAARSEVIPSSKAPSKHPDTRSPSHRGRKHTRHRSWSRTTSSSHRRSISPVQIRRRSDFDIDETRRGRSLSRTPSAHDSHISHHRPRYHHRRKRSLPPSRSRSRHDSRSPHLRRRRSRSRSRSRSPRRTRPARAGRREREEMRRWDEEQIAREEAEREGGRVGSWDDEILDTSAYYDDYHGNNKNDGYHYRADEGYGGPNYYGGGGRSFATHGYAAATGGRYRSGRGDNGTSGKSRDGRERWGSGRNDNDDVGAGAGLEVKFKGRGSMKYRERKW